MLSGAENLQFFGEVYGLSGSTLSASASRWSLDFVGLTERGSDRVSAYSGGMKRRLNLASALVHDPAADPARRADGRRRSRNRAIRSSRTSWRSKRLGRTLIYTTHYMEEAARLCDRVAIIDKGRLLALGSVPELLAAHGARPTLVAQTDRGEHRLETADPLGELNRLAATGAVTSFQMEQATLEQVFLHLTGRSLRD